VAVPYRMGVHRGDEGTRVDQLSGDRDLDAAQLPLALRPASERDIVVGLGSAGDGAIRVPVNGQLRVYGTSHVTFVSLEGVSFVVG
jgi:hypothetical protein